MSTDPNQISKNAQVVALGPGRGGAAVAAVRRHRLRHDPRLLHARPARGRQARRRRKKKDKEKEEKDRISKFVYPVVQPAEPETAHSVRQARPLGNRQPKDAGQLSRLRRRLARGRRQQQAASLSRREYAVRAPRKPARAADQGSAQVDRKHLLRSANRSIDPPLGRARRTRPGHSACAAANANHRRCRRTSTISSCWPRNRRDIRSSRRSTPSRCRSAAKRTTTRSRRCCTTASPPWTCASRSRSPTTRSPGPASPTSCGTKSIRSSSRPSRSGHSWIGFTGAGSSSSAAPIRSTCSKARSWTPTCRPTSGGPRTIAADDDLTCQAATTAG